MLIKPAISLPKNYWFRFLLIFFVDHFTLRTDQIYFLKRFILLLFHQILKFKGLLKCDLPDLSFNVLILLYNLGKDYDFLFGFEGWKILFWRLLDQCHSDVGVDEDFIGGNQLLESANELVENFGVRLFNFDFFGIEKFRSCVFHLIGSKYNFWRILYLIFIRSEK